MIELLAESKKGNTATACDSAALQRAAAVASPAAATAVADETAVAAAAANELEEAANDALQTSNELQQYSPYSLSQLRHVARAYNINIPSDCSKEALAQALLTAGKLPPFDGLVRASLQRYKRPCVQYEEQQRESKRLRTMQQQQQQGSQQQRKRTRTTQQRQDSEQQQRKRQRVSYSNAYNACGVVRVRAPSEAEKQRQQLEQEAQRIMQAKKRAAGSAGAPHGEEAADAGSATAL
jgi:hypothetical protein